MRCVWGNDESWRPLLALFLRQPDRLRDASLYLDLPMDDVATVHVQAEIILDKLEVATINKMFQAVKWSQQQENQQQQDKAA